MKAVGGIVGLVLALGIVLFIYKAEFTQGPTGGAPPAQTIDVVGVKNELLALAQAERVYMASNGSYADLDQLQKDGSTTVADGARRGYSFGATVDDGRHFKITATPTDPAKQGWPTLAIDDTMQISQQ
ncbi:MAG TPA: type IV pilin protein [Terriglobia bacterium]|nr:type IV pilin protein [Terriglobia bacterium]